MRETFFMSMLRTAHSVSIPSKGDFMVDDSIIFEVGGKYKDAGQIKEIENAWLALDNIKRVTADECHSGCLASSIDGTYQKGLSLPLSFAR